MGSTCKVRLEPCLGGAWPNCYGLLLGEWAMRAASLEQAGWTEVLRAAVAELRSSAVVAIPTNRLHGLVCMVSCSAALDAVYCLKVHIEAKPLVVCLGCVVNV